MLKPFVAALVLATAAFGLPKAATAQNMESYIGAIWLFGGNFCPMGTLPAEGQMMDIQQNAALFSLYGTVYGGDGRTTFNLPNIPGPVDGTRYCINIRGLYPSRS